MDQRVQTVIAYMEENLHRELSLTHMAGAAGLSTWRLSHLFKAETGLSTVHYLYLIRMEKARRLLETTLLEVKEVLPRVGIRDESHFRRNFKKKYGCPPSKWRGRG